MQKTQTWTYDYASKCDCSDDDNCGCTSPGNMARGYVMKNNEKNLNNPETGVGMRAINFNAPAVMADGSVNENFNLFDFAAEKYVLLIFYTADFSAVCPLEITAFNQACSLLNSRGVQIVAISVDSIPAHIAWRKLSFENGGIGQVNFPLVSDLNKNISKKYKVLHKDGMAQRATFLIDKNFNIRYQAIYDRKMERSIDETIRIIDKLIALDEAQCRGLECLMQYKATDSDISIL